MNRPRISIVAIEGAEYQLLRLQMEALGADVGLPAASTPNALLQALQLPDGEYLILSAHGNERGVLLPDLAQGLQLGQAFSDVLTPDLVREHCHLDGQILLSLACASGQEPMAAAFLDAGAAAYLGPSGYPFAEDALFFATAFFHALLAQQAGLTASFLRAKSAGRDTEQFRLYSNDPEH